MEKNQKIYIAGHEGMVGSALARCLKRNRYDHLITRLPRELDLRRQSEVNRFFRMERPEYIFLAAARVGGILANDTFRGEFIYDNLMIQSNVIHAAMEYGAKKLLFLGSSCIYPKLSPQPIKEEYLLTGALEPTNEPYAVAKIAGIKLCEAFRSQYGCNFITAMPTNLYGPNDHYDLHSSHVLPALIRKMHEAKIKKETYVEIWGNGTARREFLHVDDLAEACLFLMLHYGDSTPVNIGTGEDLTILDLAHLVKEVVGFSGKILLNPSKPDGVQRKLLDVSKIHALGWRHKIGLKEGIEKTYLGLKGEWWYHGAEVNTPA